MIAGFRVHKKTLIDHSRDSPIQDQQIFKIVKIVKTCLEAHGAEESEPASMTCGKYFKNYAGVLTFYFN